MLWGFGKNSAKNTRLAAFAAEVSVLGKYDTAHYKALLDWSVAEPEAFWNAVWDFCGVIGEKGDKVIGKIAEVPWARFFPDSKISYAENCLARVDEAPDAPAMIARAQDGPDRILSWQDLYDAVSVWEQALKGAGLGEGDKIGVYLPNVPEAMIVLLAASNIGAVFSSAGMEMGADDLINRFAQVKPKILVTQESYIHAAKQISRKDVIDRVASEIESLELIVSLNEVEKFLAPYKPQKIDFVRRDFNTPLYILFSSGSTGKPKCFEHSSGGILIKHLSEYQLNSDVQAGDRVFYHATPSWMMWNWLVGGLASGATVLLYDGNPSYPDVYAQWKFTAAHKCTHHGTAAPLILSWAGAKAEIGKHCDLKDLRVVLSTGAVLPVQGFEYIDAHVKKGVKVASISGGTDIVGCFLGANPFTPTIAGQVNGPMMGMDVDVWDENAQSAKTGEMVCKNAFPSMPLRFVDDVGGERYRGEYFETFPGRVWRHGDSIERTDAGQFVIIGRSDATLNQNGVRIGPVAIYDQLKPFMSKIKEAAAVDFSRPDNKQTITVLFLSMNDNSNAVPDDLAAAIKKAVKDNVTPYAIPTEIIAVPGVLKTPNGKTAEVVIKKILAGKAVPNASLYGEALVKNFEVIGRELTKKYS